MRRMTGGGSPNVLFIRYLSAFLERSSAGKWNCSKPKVTLTKHEEAHKYPIMCAVTAQHAAGDTAAALDEPGLHIFRQRHWCNDLSPMSIYYDTSHLAFSPRLMWWAPCAVSCDETEWYNVCCVCASIVASRRQSLFSIYLSQNCR